MQLLNDTLLSHLTVDGTNYALAAGTTDVESGYVDMANYEGVLFMVTLGDNADTATLEVKIEGCDTSDGTYAALTGATVTRTMGATDHDNKMLYLEVTQPSYRYLHLDFNRGTANSVIAAVHAIQYGAKKKPVTQSTGAGQLPAAAAAVIVSNV
jgi:hypothetical protein